MFLRRFRKFVERLNGLGSGGRHHVVGEAPTRLRRQLNRLADFETFRYRTSRSIGRETRGMSVSHRSIWILIPCGHHREIHRIGDEKAWWDNLKINAMQVAMELWENSHRPKPTKSVIDRQ